jgi:uncharacterized protein
MKTSATQRSSLLPFFALAYTLSWAVWFSMIAFSISATQAPGMLLFLGGAFGPTLAAIMVTAFRKGRVGLRHLLGTLLRWRVGIKWYVVAILGPLALGALAIWLSMLLGMSAPTLSNPALLALLAPTFVYILLLGGPLQEELGWRGFALPRLQVRHNPLVASLILGLLWGMWHVPLFWVPGTAQSALITGNPQPALWIAGFVGHVVALAVLFTWMFNNTAGSVLLVMLLHAGVNTTYSLFGLLGLAGNMAVLALYAAALAVAAVVVILVAGPARLSHRSPTQQPRIALDRASR